MQKGEGPAARGRTDGTRIFADGQRRDPHSTDSHHALTGLFARGLNPSGSPRIVDGKHAWKPIAEFRSKAIRQKFEDQVFAVLRRQHPELFVAGDAL
jgi:hypothetical protein